MNSRIQDNLHDGNRRSLPQIVGKASSRLRTAVFALTGSSTKASPHLRLVEAPVSAPTLAGSPTGIPSTGSRPPGRRPPERYGEAIILPFPREVA